VPEPQDVPRPGPMTHIASVQSPRAHDGPRHLVVHPSGERLYVVTEHTNYLDIYRITPSSSTPLEHLQSASLLPPHFRSSSSSSNPSTYRGDTLTLHPPTPSHPSPSHIFTTTRGAEPHTKGWLSVFELDVNGDLLHSSGDTNVLSGRELGIERWETPTSGGKANAIDLRVKSQGDRNAERQADALEFDTRPPQVPMGGRNRAHGRMPVVPPPSDFEPTTANNSQTPQSTLEEEEGLWILLTDDCGGISEEEERTSGCGPGVRVLDWNRKEGLKGVVAAWPNPASSFSSSFESIHDPADSEATHDGGGRREKTKDWDVMRGGSHAVWLD
jgi:carboxy-cis,cis-muconate cyclase